MLNKLASLLWGKFDDKKELEKFLILASVFGLIIAAYWILRPLKDSFFGVIVGDYRGTAKLVSLLSTVFFIVIYAKLIDWFPKQIVFYMLSVFYGLFSIVFMFVFLSSYGLTDTMASSHRMLGWIWYIFVESCGSLVISLFWAFVTDITGPVSAKKGFPIIALFGQLGNVFGPVVVLILGPRVSSNAYIIGMAGILLLLAGLLMWVFIQVIPAEYQKGYHKGQHAKGKTGFLDGLRLLLTQKYLFAIFIIMFLFESISEIIDLYFKSLAQDAFPLEADMTHFMAIYSLVVGIVSASCVLFGLNSLQRIFGMRFALVVVPIALAVGLVFVLFNMQSLYVMLILLVLFKALNYSFSQPTVKQLYIPTTEEAKYKAQAWIDSFGRRFAKGVSGSADACRSSLVATLGAMAGVNAYLAITTVLSLFFIGILWIPIAVFAAKSYNVAIDNDEVVC
ncbi:MAG: hypothetical protein UR26_C0003G0075 [candidate division TM6 bacterium GW2011_GWF2_32_72]|nr:MAG: hypothetical protein UR26_C0003G0075 [candidate division TM6 bacterium GW2011_GWF2_32_72]